MADIEIIDDNRKEIRPVHKLYTGEMYPPS